MTQNRTKSLERMLNTVTAEEFRMIPRLIAGLPQSSLGRRMLVGMYAELCQNKQREDEILAALAADNARQLDEAERAAGIPPIPPATGVAMTFDPESGEFRRVD